MDFLKHVPESPVSLADLIEYKEGRVISMMMSRSEAAQIMLMSVSLGEKVTSEIYPGDMLYYVVDGEMPLIKDGITYPLHTGDCMAVAAGTAHAIGGNGEFKVLQITINVK